MELVAVIHTFQHMYAIFSHILIRLGYVNRITLH